MDQRLILSVSQINARVKELISTDDILCDVFVRGEISNLKFHSSGHVYLTLKDDGGVIRAVMFRSSASKLKFKPDYGMKVIAHGRVDVFARAGEYQLYIDELIPDGIGALYIAYEQLKAKLQAEGLFAEEHKKPVPKAPMKIALVTSPTGAAVRDMLRILRARWPIARIRLFPVRVQGPEAPAEICEGINFINATNAADVIITGRGGGSIEDLWAFNDETVARTIYASRIPVISAVGHEPDFTISDFVADLRAATPSNGAELCVPDRGELMAQMKLTEARLCDLTRHAVSSRRQYVAALANKKVLTDPLYYFTERRMTLMHDTQRFEAAVQRELTGRREKLSRLSGVLDAMSPMKVLARGYAMATNDDGDIVRDSSELGIGQNIKVRFARGGALCKVAEIDGGAEDGRKENDL